MYPRSHVVDTKRSEDLVFYTWQSRDECINEPEKVLLLHLLAAQRVHRCKMFAFRHATFLLPLLHLLTIVNALHFYLDANEKRCFIEELPSDTVVEGMCSNSNLWGYAS